MKIGGVNLPGHISESDLLMMADGELAAGREAEVRAHLAACWGCRARLAMMEGTIVEFTQAHQQTLDAQLPDAEGPRALLRAHLERMAGPRKSGLLRGMQSRAVVAFAVVLIAAGGVFAWMKWSPRGNRLELTAVERGVVPDPRLTPGATRVAEVGELCEAEHEEVVGQVNAPLRQEVFREYGIRNSRAKDYEVDYLIAPGLGGAEDIHNLWPESFQSRQWNAFVKDQLEERLHQMVCDREVDLSTAQHDISTDWIAAYKKYFHTDRPPQS